MATIQKFYFHNTTSTDTGTLPSAYRGSTLGNTATGASTARAMDDVHGSAQVATASTTTSLTTWTWFRQFVSAPLAAQTFGSGTWTLASAGSSPQAMDHNFVLFVWRPSSGTAVGTIFDATGAGLGLGATPMQPSEEGEVGSASGINVTCQDGDILAVQIVAIGSGSGASTGIYNYDGTTDPVDFTSTSDAASYLNAPAAITLANLTPGVVATVNFAYGPN